MAGAANREAVCGAVAAIVAVALVGLCGIVLEEVAGMPEGELLAEVEARPSSELLWSSFHWADQLPLLALLVAQPLVQPQRREGVLGLRLSSASSPASSAFDEVGFVLRTGTRGGIN